MINKEISNEIFLFLTDFNIFYEKVKISSLKINDIEKMKINIDFFYNKFKELNSKTLIKFSSKIFEQLKSLKCNENLIFEKADLIVNFLTIKEEIESIKHT